MTDTFHSPLLDEAVHQLSRLPGIGRKTALRLALHLLRSTPDVAKSLSEAIAHLRSDIVYCRRCHNISTGELCPICASPLRDQHTLCVVENVQDVLGIEATGQYRGLYHVLGGLIAPLEGVGPGELQIASLPPRITGEEIKEVILALSPTMEGDTTGFYIYKLLKDTGVTVSIPARGLAMGSDLEYTDPLTLGRSLQARVPFDSTFADA